MIKPFISESAKRFDRFIKWNGWARRVQPKTSNSLSPDGRTVAVPPQTSLQPTGAAISVETLTTPHKSDLAPAKTLGEPRRDDAALGLVANRA
jgi:hypothetical protein